MRKRRTQPEEAAARGVTGSEASPGRAEPGLPGAASSGDGAPEPRRKRRRFTAEEEQELVDGFLKSGQSITAFCESQGVSASTLAKWRRKRGYLHGRTAGRAKRTYSPEERRAAVEAFRKSGRKRVDFSKLWGISPSSLDKWVRTYDTEGPKGLEPKPRKKHRRREHDPRRLPEHVRDQVVDARAKNPDWGLRRIRDFLLRFRGTKVSAGTVRNVLHERGVPPLPPPKKQPRARVKPPRRFERARPGEMWQSDITSYVMRRPGRRVYLTVFLDDHSRYVVAWKLATHQRSDLVTEPLLEGISRFGKPREVLTDQGRQYFAWRGKSRFQKLLDREGLQHVVSRTHHPQTLGKCERLWKTINTEYWERAKPEELSEAREGLEHYFAHYNHFRPHQGINGSVPADRFFGAEEALRRNLEERMAEDELRLAIEPPEREAVYLFGRVGEHALSLHGRNGELVVHTSDGVHREMDMENLGTATRRPRDGRASTDGTEAETHENRPQAHGLQAAEEAGGGGARPVAVGERGGAEAGARAVRPDAGALAGEALEEERGGSPRGDAAARVADEPAGGVGDDGGALEAAAESARASAYREPRSGERPYGAEEAHRTAREVTSVHGGPRAGAADGTMDAGSEGGEADEEEEGCPRQASEGESTARRSSGSERNSAAGRTRGRSWRRWLGRWADASER